MLTKIFDTMSVAGRFLMPAIALASIVVACSSSDTEPTTPGTDAADASTSTSLDDASPSEEAGTQEASTGARACGNHKLEAGEACDDGNTSNDDGCSATCTIESAGPEDVCGGIPLTLTTDGGTTLYMGHALGTTAGLYNQYSSNCGGSGPEAVYKIESPAAGRAIVRLTADFLAVASIRSSCEDAMSEIACGAVGSDGDASGLLSFPIHPGTPVYLMVDGYGSTKGDYVLDVEVQTAFCGNGTAEHPETCDDGNTVDGDGCSHDCLLEDTASPSTCPGMSYRLAATATKPGVIGFAGDTTPLTNPSYGGATSCTSNGAGPNAIYAITPTVTGNLTVDLRANYTGAVLHVRRECADTSSQFDCAPSSAVLAPTTLSIPVVAEQMVYVFVDGNLASYGMYTVEATLNTSACGNGAIDGSEECDDGNSAAGDGCSASCMVERDSASYSCPGKLLRLEAPNGAGDTRTLTVRGITTPAPGEALPGSKVATCGTAAPDVAYAITSDIDGTLTVTVDDATFPVGLGMRSACPGTADVVCDRSAVGNGKKAIRFNVDKETPYYVFVDSLVATRSGSFLLDLALTRSVCGDGVVGGGETCDDGAQEDGDGCDRTCHLETDRSHDECATAPTFMFADNPDGTKTATIVSGTTNLTHSGATNSFSPCSSIGPDGHYPFVAPVDGVVTATLSSASFKPSIGVRADCGTGTPLSCDGAVGVAGYEITFGVTHGFRYDIMIAGISYNSVPQVGRFTMNVKLAPAGCGDSVVSGGEVCDDGNVVDGDGCSSKCTAESMAAMATCPGFDVPLMGTGTSVRSAVVTVDTAPLQSKNASACGGSGNEGIVKIVPDVSGQLQVKSTANFSTLVYARSSCSDPNTEIARASCTTNPGSYATAVTMGTPYYIFVDGLGGQSGVATLKITVTP